MRITLLRHGKPKFELTGNARASELSEISKSYDLSGIHADPSKDSIIQAKRHNIIVCSNLPRSIQSAKALGVTEVHSISPLFREADIPYFTKGSIKLPVSTWIIVMRGLWFFGLSKNGESLLATRKRAKKATGELILLAKQFESVMLVGHGFINHFIAKELLSSNWSGPKKPASEYWGCSTYRYNPT